MKTIHVILAVHRPDPVFLRAQIASIAAQSHIDLHLWLVAADLTSGPDALALAHSAGVRVTLLTPDAPCDAVRAFAFGLRGVLDGAPEARFLALADQDDIWHPRKLERCMDELERGGDLVHCDARVVDAEGRELAPSLWRAERRLRAPGLRDLLYRNSVTGMATLFTRRVAELALPFPEQSGVHFYHDLWLALVAEALSGLRRLDLPLVDYRQHGGNAVGALGQAPRDTAPRWAGRAWARACLAEYARARYLAKALSRRATEASGNPRLAIPRDRLEALRPFLAPHATGIRLLADVPGLLLRGAPAQARQAALFGLTAAGRLAYGLRGTLRRGLTPELARLDARAYALSPGVPPTEDRAGAAVQPRTVVRDWRSFADARRQARWTPVMTADRPALVVLVPTLNPTEVFAGIATAIELGMGLAARGVPVRFVATDLPIVSTAASRAFLAARLPDGGPTGKVMERVSLHCGVSAARLPHHPEDRFMATAWWTAHVVRGLVDAHGFRPMPILYLVQDYEPGFYPWGDDFAGASESYDFDIEPIFNTELLRHHFEALGHDFARQALVFRPALSLDRYLALPDRRRPQGPRRLVLYGRPEVARNLFPLAVESLGRFLEEEELGPKQIELLSIGLVHAPVRMPGGLVLQSLGKLPWDRYPEFLSGVDIGLSLMLSPHPSHPPLEMAAAGARVVTNGFGTKDLSRLSPLILSAAPTCPALTEALALAWHAPPGRAADRRLALDLLGPPLAEVVSTLARDLHQAWRTAPARDARKGALLREIAS